MSISNRFWFSGQSSAYPSSLVEGILRKPFRLTSGGGMNEQDNAIFLIVKFPDCR
jgi:hypothetical protein